MFSEVIVKTYNFDTFDSKQAFVDYDNFEIYDVNKQYTTNSFQYNYGRGLRTYQYELHKIYNKNNTDVKLFVVANEILKENNFDKYYSLFCLI